ncbi:hypothetical protein DPMN_018578 [Dreissena polymorpha]|uniref:Uncharacterized protein n=1 Tax=Dreissena polymorpha TaxID=45954 RepID=A0A9D4S7F0_DREPO|nr:hypothetical protein DPMN_018578 [Dreissena polymorpha]
MTGFFCNSKGPGPAPKIERKTNKLPCLVSDERVLIRRAAHLREVLYRRHCPQLPQAQERVPTEDVQWVGVPAPGR